MRTTDKQDHIRTHPKNPVVHQGCECCDSQATRYYQAKMHSYSSGMNQQGLRLLCLITYRNFSKVQVCRVTFVKTRSYHKGLFDEHRIRRRSGELSDYLVFPTYVARVTKMILVSTFPQQIFSRKNGCLCLTKPSSH